MKLMEERNKVKDQSWVPFPKLKNKFAGASHRKLVYLA
jgi:hypothetical protein